LEKRILFARRFNWHAYLKVLAQLMMFRLNADRDPVVAYLWNAVGLA